MTPDYTINDAHKDGFECGLLYILRFVEQESGYTTVWYDDDISGLASHLAEKKPWKSRDEWYEFLRRNLDRWRVRNS